MIDLLKCARTKDQEIGEFYVAQELRAADLVAADL